MSRIWQPNGVSSWKEMDRSYDYIESLQNGPVTKDMDSGVRLCGWKTQPHLLTSYVFLGNLFNFSKPQFPDP